MKARDGLECEDKRKPSNHGKDIADCDRQALKGMVKGHIMMIMAQALRT